MTSDKFEIVRKCARQYRIRVGINGFGRIGRQVFRIISQRSDMVVTHINADTDIQYIAYLLKYDTVHGRFKGLIEFVSNSGKREPCRNLSEKVAKPDIRKDLIVVNGVYIALTTERDPFQIPWADSGVDYVCESTGAFLTTETALKHVSRDKGCKKVVISAPARDTVTPTLIVGVNAVEEYEAISCGNVNNPNPVCVVSNGSCTTNALAPIVKVLNDKFGITEAFLTTIHSVTKSQPVLDGVLSGRVRDWRGNRSALCNIVPTSTGAAQAVAKCIPSLENKLTGIAMRVPTADVSCCDISVRLDKSTTVEEINETIREASSSYMSGIIGYTTDPVVSGDYVGSVESSIYDASLSMSISSQFFKLIAWYDNEWGYSVRLVDLIHIMSEIDDGITTSKVRTVSELSESMPKFLHLPIYNVPSDLLYRLLYIIQEESRTQKLYCSSQSTARHNSIVVPLDALSPISGSDSPEIMAIPYFQDLPVLPDNASMTRTSRRPSATPLNIKLFPVDFEENGKFSSHELAANDYVPKNFTA